MEKLLSYSMKYILILFLVLPIESSGQHRDYKEFTINNGLPHTDANCTVQDNKGFLWFATLDGLCRYDGSEIIVYRNDHSDPNSISNNRINILEFDVNRNGIWIGTQGGGLNFLDLVSGKFHKININQNGKPVKEVISIKIAGFKSLWIGTHEGLYVGTIINQKPYLRNVGKIKLESNVLVQSIYQDVNKGMWLGSLSALFYKPPGKGNFVKINADKLREVYAVTAYDDKHVLIGTLGGLFLIDLDNFALSKLNDLKVTSLLTDGAGSIWAGTFSEGLFHCKANGSIDQNYKFGLAGETRKNFVKNIFKDRASSLLISTLGGGIKVINKNNYTFKNYPKNVTATEFARLKKPLCFYADDNKLIYIGIQKYGLAIYNRVSDKVKFYQVNNSDTNSIAGNDITAIFKDIDGKLWMGKGDGIYIINANDVRKQTINNRSFKHIPNFHSPFRVNKIIQDKQLRVWVVTSRGLFCYTKEGELVFTTNNLHKEYASINTDFLNDIILKEKDQGKILVAWLATKSGISKLELDNHTFAFLGLKKFSAGDADNQLFSNWISLLHEDQENNIWAGTIGGGLSGLIPGKNGNYTFKTITTNDGLVTNDIETLLEDQEGNFWIGSLGLTKYNPKNKSFSYYDANDGLQSNAFKVWAAFKRDNGEMIFGGINGFNIFYPQNISKKPKVFTPQLTNLIINSRTVKPGSVLENDVILKNTLPYTSEITLNHKIRNFGLEFASIHTHDFQKIIYRYRLLGYNKDWTYTNSKKRFVNYTGLLPGDYIFELSASGGEDMWTSEPLILKVHVLPSFWESTYAYLLYAFIILGGLFLQRRYTLIRLDIKHKLKIDKARQEQEIKSYEDKMQFFTNVSHELRTPLTLITSPIEQLVNHADTPRAVNDKLTIVQKNADRLRHLIDQILDIRKLELGKIQLNKEKVSSDKFLNSIIIQFKDLAEKKKITLTIGSQSAKHILIDVFKMEQVLINLLSNAIKFTPENGKISLKSCMEDNKIVIHICNSGSLLNKEQQIRIFEPFYQAENKNNQGTGLGLTISKYLVELHGGAITVNSKIDEKSKLPQTCFTICLPILNEGPDIISVKPKLPPETAASRVASSDNQLSIVIVDDNDELRGILKEEFINDYKIYEADNGRKGLKIIRKVKPTLVITDVMMPDIDGIAMCKSLKSDVATNDIPVIMLTAKGTELNRLEGLEVMADAYISKPFNLRELHLKVKNLINQMATLKGKLNNEMALKPATLNFMARDQVILKSIIAIIEDNIDNPDFSVEHLCKKAGFSRPVLYRKIKELTGMSIQIFILDIRLKRAAQLLATKNFSVSEVMYQTGFSSPSYFNKAFKKKYSYSPHQHIKMTEKG